MTAIDNLLTGNRQPQPLLRAAIHADAQRSYTVTHAGASTRPVGDLDYLRFALHYYARVLYELAHQARTVRDLPALIDAVSAAGVGWNCDVFAAASVDARLVPAVAHPIGCVSVEMKHVGTREFEVEGDFRLTGRALALSVLAVLQSILPNVSPDSGGAILAALANMNASYTMTHRYADRESCREVPAIAYLAASFV